MSRIPQLAIRNVGRNKRRSAITLAAIISGVTLMVLLRGLGDGFIALLVEDEVKGNTGALQVHRKGYVGNLDGFPNHLNMPYSEEFMARIKAVPGVTGLSGRILFSGMVSNGQTQTMFVGRAVDPVQEKQVCPRSASNVLPGGEALAQGDHGQVLVGYELAESFDAVPSQQKQAALAEGKPEAARLTEFLTLSSTSPEGRANAMDVQVKGLVSSGTPIDNKRSLVVPLPLAQELLGLQGKVTEYALAVEDLGELERVAAGLRQALGPEYEVHTWTEVRPFFRDLIRNQGVILGMVGFILLVIVLTGIVNTMLMSVFERVREIGTMLAVGTRKRQVLQLFLLEAGTLGLVGGLVGGLLGKGLVTLIALQGIEMNPFGGAHAKLLRPTVDTSFLIGVTVVAVVGALVSAAYPAWKASRLNPVEALRSL